MAKEQEIVDTAPFITGEWGEPQTVSFNQRDLLTYAVGIGCDEMKFIYEGDAGFEPFPTYPVLLDMKGDTQDVNTAASVEMYYGKLKEPPPGSPTKRQPRPKIPGVKVGVDAERYIEKIKPLPSSGGTFQIRSRLLGIHKKGSGALTETESELFDPATGEVYYKFVGAGFGIGAHSFKDGGKNFSQKVDPPSRDPDAVYEEHVADNQAHIYRLSGDYNPLHIDPESPFVSGGGFPAPILHGLCTMGHAIRHVRLPLPCLALFASASASSPLDPSPYHDERKRLVRSAHSCRFLCGCVWGWQVLKTFANNDASQYKASAVRFSSPVRIQCITCSCSLKCFPTRALRALA